MSANICGATTLTNRKRVSFMVQGHVRAAALIGMSLGCTEAFSGNFTFSQCNARHHA